MKTQVSRLLVLGLFSTMSFVGCTSHHPPAGAVVVTPGGQIVSEAPPAAKVETMGPAPGSAYVWIPGYWTRNNDRWAWMSGHYELRPTASAAWAPGTWVQTSSGWVWTPGHWH